MFINYIFLYQSIISLNMIDPYIIYYYNMDVQLDNCDKIKLMLDFDFWNYHIFTSFYT